MKKILLVCIYNFYQWKGNVRVVCTFLLLLGYLFSILRPIREFCALVQEPCTPWVFPFITSEPTCVMLLMLLFILLLCDIPFLYPDQKYVLFRAGKKHWICGQVLYAGMVSFLFWVTVLIGSVLSLLPQLTASHQWGKVLYTLSQTAQVGDIFFFFAIDYKLIVGFSPVQACLIAFLLAWLVSFWLAELMLFLNMWGIKSLGIMFGLFFILFQNFAELASGYWVYKLSPVSWMSMSFLNFSAGKNNMPSFSSSVFLLSCSICLLFALIFQRMRRYSIDLFS